MPKHSKVPDLKILTAEVPNIFHCSQFILFFFSTGARGLNVGGNAGPSRSSTEIPPFPGKAVEGLGTI